MADNIVVFVTGIGIEQVLPVEIAGDAMVGNLLDMAHRSAPVTGVELDSVMLFREDGECELETSLLLVEAGIANGSVTHRHHRKRIEVEVSYNGISKRGGFPPATRVAKLLAWAEDEFTVTDRATAEYGLLISGSRTFLPEDDHLGKIAQHGHMVQLSLAVKHTPLG